MDSEILGGHDGSHHFSLYDALSFLLITSIYLVCMSHVELRGQPWQPFLSFLHVSPGDQTLVVRFGSKLLYSLNHLTSPTHSWSYVTLAFPAPYIALCDPLNREGASPDINCPGRLSQLDKGGPKSESEP